MAINQQHLDQLCEHLEDAFSDAEGDFPEMDRDEIAYDLIQSVVLSNDPGANKETLRDFVRIQLGPGVMQDILR